MTKRYPDSVRMCCLSAVGAGSETHIKIFREAKAVITINGCQLMCASNILRQRDLKITYEVTVAKEGVNKLPSLDYTDEEVEKIAGKIVNEFLQENINNQSSQANI